MESLRNKSWKRRCAAAILAALTVLPLTACGKSRTNEDETQAQDGTSLPETEVSTERQPLVGKNNYQEEFHALYCPDTYHEGYYFVKDEDRKAGNDLEDRVYERMIRIKDYLGVEIVPVNGGNFQEYGGVLKQSVKAHDDEYQMVMTHVTADIVPMITENYLLDFRDFDHIHTEEDYWNQSIMQELAIYGHEFCGYSDFCLAQCNVFVFNKDMADEYRSEIGNLYDSVRNHEWTLDKMMKTAAVAYKDNGDGVRDTNDDYGITGPAREQLVSFSTSCGIDLVRRDPKTNQLYLSPMKDNKEKIVDLTRRIYEFSKQDCNAMWKFQEAPEKIVWFTDGHALLAVMDNFQMVDASKKTVRFGVLPYPMYDEKQENYRTMSWNGVLGIPTTVSDRNMVGDTIEMLAFYAEPVKTSFFETLLKSKVADAPDDAEMLNILWDTLICEMGLTYSSVSPQLGSLLYAIPFLLEQDRDNYTAYYAQFSKGSERALRLMLQKFD